MTEEKVSRAVARVFHDRFQDKAKQVAESSCEVLRTARTLGPKAEVRAMETLLLAFGATLFKEGRIVIKETS